MDKQLKPLSKVEKARLDVGKHFWHWYRRSKNETMVFDSRLV